MTEHPADGRAGQLRADEVSVVAALRAGEEGAFRDLVTRYHPSLVRLASGVVGSHAVAEEVAQDTWLAVIRGLDDFQYRSSLKTWIFGILMNQARTRRRREQRSIPVSFTASDGADHGHEGGGRW